MKLPNFLKALNINIVFLVLAFFGYKGVTAYNYHNSYEYKLKKYNDCLDVVKREGFKKEGFLKFYEIIREDIKEGKEFVNFNGKEDVDVRDLVILCMQLRAEAIDSLSGSYKRKYVDLNPEDIELVSGKN